MDGEFINEHLINGKEYIYKSNGLIDFIRIYEDGRYVRDEFLDTDYFRKMANNIKIFHKNMIILHWRNFRILMTGINRCINSTLSY